jgi:hypothetical protein
MDEPTELVRAIRVLTAAGAVVSVPQRHVSLETAAKMLDCSKGWVREHLREFPHAWRMPGACGEWRIPVRDVEALARRQRVQEVTA